MPAPMLLLLNAIFLKIMINASSKALYELVITKPHKI